MFWGSGLFPWGEARAPSLLRRALRAKPGLRGLWSALTPSPGRQAWQELTGVVSKSDDACVDSSDDAGVDSSELLDTAKYLGTIVATYLKPKLGDKFELKDNVEVPLDLLLAAPVFLLLARCLIRVKLCLESFDVTKPVDAKSAVQACERAVECLPLAVSAWEQARKRMAENPKLATPELLTWAQNRLEEGLMRISEAESIR